MKKILAVLIMSVLAIPAKFRKLLSMIVMFAVISLPVMASAAWTITVAKPVPSEWMNDQVVYMVQVSLVSDGSDLAEFSLADEMATDLGSDIGARWINHLNGGVLYQLVTDPGVQPDSTYTLAFDDNYGASLLDLAALSATVSECTRFSADLGFNPIFWGDLDIDIGDIGSNLDATVLYIFIVK